MHLSMCERARVCVCVLEIITIYSSSFKFWFVQYAEMLNSSHSKCVRILLPFGARTRVYVAT